MKIKHTPYPWSLGVHGLVMNDTFDHVVANVLGDCVDEDIILLAPTAPHDCDVEDCPGRKNKRKLEAGKKLFDIAKNILDPVLTMDQYTNLRHLILEYEGKE